ncbi:CHASE3 domain-containing protein [Flavobacterium sp.]|uniref:CHASE3 domain-containing protein n=1 Tax=Flavobacterium sp. TaxID=239 RepID=UPI00286E3F0E|nr:CHASE3 domain-containing protein [Flavobacterium sp.]
MKFLLDKTISSFYSLTVIVLAILFGVYFYNTQSVKKSSDLVEHTQEVLLKNNTVLLNVIDIETGTRGFILTGKESFLEPYNKSIISVEKNLSSLQLLSKDFPKQKVRIEFLQKKINEKLRLSKQIIAFHRNSSGIENEKVYDLEKGQAITDSIRILIEEINNAEIVLLKQRKTDSTITTTNSETLLGLLFLFIAIIVILVFYIFKNHKKTSTELVVANKELLYQSDEKQNRADELDIANIELAHQQSEKQNRADELGIANIELDFQKNLAQQQAYSRSLIEASRDPLFTISPDGKITDTNQASVRVTDVSKENLIGSDFITYFTEPEKAKSGYEEVFSKGFVIDYSLTIKDGKLTPVLFNGSVYKDTNNNIIGAVVVARDISAQKKAEKELLELLNEVTDYKLALDASTIVDITDKDGNIKFVNENYTKISKYTFDELVGGSHSMVNSKFHPTAFMENLWERISKGKIWKGEIRNKAKDGSFYWLNMTIVPFRDDMGLPFQYVAISIDITKQKELEQELMEAKVFAELATTIAEESRNSAEDAVKSKQQFLSNMSHEIRTPMNAIIGFTKVVLKTELTAKQKEYLMAIKMSGDSLIVLINDILDLAKVDSGKMTFEKTPFKLALSITAMLNLFETKIQEKNLELITNYDATIPGVILGDPIRLNQIILNLVSNAVKFTNKGTIAVNIKMLSQDDEKVQIEFSVIDTGIGIKPTKIGKIFENFQQATNTTSRLYGGTGLGLAIVKQLVEAQGGSIKIDSTFGKGSTFSIVLDFKKTNIDAVLEPEILELNTDVKNIKILVVEDMELNQLLMKTLLDDFGFECDITANGQLAIEKLETKTYDIILMDLQMPVMNGFEATEYIRKKMKLKMPIIALTADVTTVDVEKCKAVGMNDYISKPVDERLLYSKLIAYSKKPIAIIEHIKGEVHSKDTIKYVDMSYLTKLTKSDPNLMSQMINAYLQQTPPLILSMKKSLVDKDWKMLQSAVHKMIPSFSIIGLSSNIHDIAKRIQEYAFTIEITGEIQNMVLELEKVCTQSCIELEIELEKLKIENLEKRK